MNITKPFLPHHVIPNCLSLSKAFKDNEEVVDYVHHFSTVRFADKWTKMAIENQGELADIMVVRTDYFGRFV